ncbi:RNA polymerase sigma factor [Massilia cavernae]|uniref:RNA polymerase sigma factor n=1 Tax=Massilia cavernae TaxID=2320864 RepID=A0A418XGJ1_9BURK|nr:RNA polymerase sigma factor [Massilia cavernae]RJG11580.1 RNA polymerase sigma factor [Massilia cavernae]
MEQNSAQLVSCIPRLRRYARALVGSRAEADDLVQDTLERGWSKLASCRLGSDMRPWMFGIMHNLYVDQLRKQVVATVELDEDTLVPSYNAPQMQGLEIRDMQAALTLLPVEQREILLLVALEEMTYEEISSTLSIPLGTVMSRLSRGRERLRLLMDGKTIPSRLKVVK